MYLCSLIAHGHLCGVIGIVHNPARVRGDEVVSVVDVVHHVRVRLEPESSIEVVVVVRVHKLVLVIHLVEVRKILKMERVVFVVKNKMIYR